ncbi:polysialyltransferase family glycosyltransferase [Pontibacter harenae]|uniref:polysialyltransferase family glycosyltransferase n=1 Tax=Pontibacter harenae TaxID=2894083 RepID=UPI001E3D1E7A|nr:polysialyltransferase family glycosyltransferase [Pontibacter harenae]MCC9168863.1 hypothetical protein [Pontibacter harenae]
MQPKPKIIFIGDYSRTDYLHLLEEVKEHCEFFLLHYASPKEEKNKDYKRFGKAIYWKDFKSAFSLLSFIKPQKVVFLYIDTYYQLVLNLACKHSNIPTFHLEHGLRADYDIAFDIKISPQLHKKPFQKIRDYSTLLQKLKARLKARKFLNKSIKELPEEEEFIRSYIEVRRNHNYLDSFKRFPTDKRVADTYISFSPKVFETHQKHDYLPQEHRVYFIGVPYFDAFHYSQALSIQKAILFIDQPLAEHRLLNWTPAYKEAFVRQLVKMCSLHNYRLYIKPHPIQNVKPWLEQNAKETTLLTNEQLLASCKSFPIIMGFYSTYLMPFAALEHTTLLTYENHPAGNFLVSKPFVDAGVAHPVYDLNELHEILPNIEKLHQKQLPNKKKFEEDWLYKFDGKAGARLRDILLSDNL